MKGAETFLALLIAQGLVFGLPFRLTARLFHVRKPSGGIETNARHAFGRTIGIRVERVADRLPWKSTCLVRALAGSMLLWRRGIASSIRLGVRKEDDALAAHAWLMVGEAIVLGGGSETASFVSLADLASS